MKIKVFLQFMYHTFLDFYRGSCGGQVTTLTLVTLLSIVPLLIVTIFVASFFPFFYQSLTWTQVYVAKTFLPDVASAVEVYLKNFIDQSKQLPLVTIIFLFVTVVFLLNTIETALNEIWQVLNKKDILYKITLYASFIIIIPILIGFSMLSVYYIVYSTFFSRYIEATIIKAVLHVLPVTINVFLFTFLYTYVPNAQVSWKNGLVGGILAAGILEITRIGFSFYIKQFTNYSILYGTFAAFPIFLTWLYVFWFNVLFFAFVVKKLGESNFTPQSQPLNSSKLILPSNLGG